jgi:hypothetical protein
MLLMAATVSARRQALAELARSRRPTGLDRWIRPLAISIVALGLVGLAVLWLLGFFSSPRELLAVRAAVDGEVAELERMASGEVPFGAGSASFGSIMQVMRDVPEQYRDQARREMGRLFEARERAEVSSYFAIPPERRAAELDRRLKEEEARRSRWQAERDRRMAERGDAGGAARGQQMGGGTGAAPAQRGGAAGQPRRRGDGTEEGRNTRSKQRLDRSTADARARSTEYRRAKDQRRIQLGLEPRR